MDEQKEFEPEIKEEVRKSVAGFVRKMVQSAHSRAAQNTSLADVDIATSVDNFTTDFFLLFSLGEDGFRVADAPEHMQSSGVKIGYNKMETLRS